MSNDKSFRVAGVSTVKGNYKVRFANDLSRVKVLMKTGHTEIELCELPSAMSKGEAVTFLKTTELVNRPEYLQAIEAADAKYNQDVKTVVVTKAKPSLSNIKARGTKNTASVGTKAPEAA
jgi:hypothetical protein